MRCGEDGHPARLITLRPPVRARPPPQGRTATWQLQTLSTRHGVTSVMGKGANFIIMYRKIDNAEAFVRFLDRYRTHNEACSTLEHTRKVKLPDGTIREMKYERRTGLLPEQLKTTFYILLQEYVKAYNEVAESAVFVSKELPSLLTNNVRLAEICDCTDRTIRNHMRTMADLKLLRTKFRGREHNFELWISEEILWENAENKKSRNPSKSAFSPTSGKTFPHSNIYVEKIVNEKGDADKLKSGQGKNSKGQRGETATTMAKTESSEPHTERTGLGGGAAAATDEESHTEQIRQRRFAEIEAKRPALPPKLEKYFAEMLIQFWMYAWKVLYPSRDFSKEEQEKAITAIYSGVYNRFDDARTAVEWATFQARQLEKLDKAARYYDYHPDAYLPDPFAVYVAGRGYFDAANTRGFAGVEAWLQKDEALAARRHRAYAEEQEKKQKRGESLLRQARRDFEKLRAEQPVRKELTGKDMMGVWNYYRLIFDGLGKKWQDKFMKQYLEQQANDFQPPQYFKPRRQRQLAKGTIVVNVEDYMTWGDGEDGYYS